MDVSEDEDHLEVISDSDDFQMRKMAIMSLQARQSHQKMVKYSDLHPQMHIRQNCWHET